MSQTVLSNATQCANAMQACEPRVQPHRENMALDHPIHMHLSVCMRKETSRRGACMAKAKRCAASQPAARASACKAQRRRLRLALQHRNCVRGREAVPGTRRVDHLSSHTELCAYLLLKR